MTCDDCKNKTKGATIIHTRKLPTQLILQISRYNAIDYSEDNSKARVNKVECSVQIDLILNLMSQGVNMK